MNDLEQFIIRLRTLHNIDGNCLEPGFDYDKQAAFCRDPVRYILSCSDEDRAVIWRELDKRYQRNWKIYLERWVKRNPFPRAVEGDF